MRHLVREEGCCEHHFVREALIGLDLRKWDGGLICGCGWLMVPLRSADDGGREVVMRRERERETRWHGGACYR